MSSDLTRKRKHSDVSAVSTADRRQGATPSAALLPPVRPRDYEVATEIAHSSTIRAEHCVAQDQARVQYGNTYVQNQYNGHTLGSQQHSGNINQRIDFVEALAFDGMDSRYESIDPAHINTCQWLFQKPKYLQWRNPEHLASHDGFLWIKGKAGTGKSTLMKCAFEHAEENFPHDAIISFFFNARGQHLEKSVEGMYRSLLSQTLRHFPQLRLQFPTHSPVSVQQQGWAVAALRNHLHRAVTSLGRGEAISLYIDALDECEEEDIREAIEHFEDLGLAALSIPISLHICFASRYYPRISIQHCIELQLENQVEHQQDIRKYINGRLAIRDTAFKTQLAPQIESRASGVFFWVVLVVRLIKKKCDGGASHSEISKSLQEVPDKLQELIGAIIRSPDDALLCTLRWMLFSRLPLKLEELYFAIRTGTDQLASGFWDSSEVNRDDMEAFIIASSRGLVEVKHDEWGGTRTELVHESVREYLMAGGLKDLGSCSDKMVAANNHAELFKWCQTYLGSIAGGHVATFEDGDRWGAVDVARTYRSYPLLKYAGLHILYHFEVACIAGILRSSSLREFPIRQFIYPNFLNEDLGPEISQELLKPHRFFTSLLYVVIHRGYAQIAEALLAENAVHSSRINDRGCTHAAASTSDLLTAKIDLNLHFEERPSSLLELALECCPDIVRPLLDHGADVNVNGGAPLYRAVELCSLVDGNNMEDAVLLLLTRGAHAQVYERSREMTALTLAVRCRSLAIVTLLLDHGADANDAIGTPAVSPLLAALRHGLLTWEIPDEAYELTLGPLDENMVRALLEHGADVLLRNGPEQISPLQFAIMHGGKDIIRLLTSYIQRDVDGADLSLVSAAREMIESWNDEQ
jgi:ankyrin repeat protein